MLIAATNKAPIQFFSLLFVCIGKVMAVVIQYEYLPPPHPLPPLSVLPLLLPLTK